MPVTSTTSPRSCATRNAARPTRPNPLIAIRYMVSPSLGAPRPDVRAAQCCGIASVAEDAPSDDDGKRHNAESKGVTDEFPEHEHVSSFCRVRGDGIGANHIAATAVPYECPGGRTRPARRPPR